VADAYATKGRINPDAVWTPAYLPSAAELNVLPPIKK
jgi:NitT/TauT family transport system substrate-binding protein